jgi:hypothetical protein
VKQEVGGRTRVEIEKHLLHIGANSRLDLFMSCSVSRPDAVSVQEALAEN